MTMSSEDWRPLTPVETDEYGSTDAGRQCGDTSGEESKLIRSYFS